MSTARTILLTLSVTLGLTLGLACPLEPPDFWGRYWCFVTEGAFGFDVESGERTSIHRDGHPIQTCICFCDQLHADTLLFTGEDPPTPSDDWLSTMEFHRTIAIQRCRNAALELGLINDNCEEATPQYPSWRAQDRQCAGGFSTNTPYCQDPGENGDGETSGTEDTGEPTTASSRASPQ